MRTSDEFRSARERLEALRAANRLLERELGRKCDWDDPEDRAAYLRSVRSKDREELLTKLLPQRTCPICEQLRLSSAQWVVNKAKTRAICKRCFWSQFGAERVSVNLRVSLFEEETRFIVDSRAVKTARLKAGLSLSEFARRAGWSRSWQKKLESPTEVSKRTIHGEAASVILTVLREAGVITNDVTT